MGSFRLTAGLALTALASGLFAAGVSASSHREAPFIAGAPKVDGTDFYLFRSYEQGRDGFVTMIANYQPLQDAYGGPNYFTMDPQALYEIHIDNNGDSREDLTFQFQFSNASNKHQLVTRFRLTTTPKVKNLKKKSANSDVFDPYHMSSTQSKI